MVRGATDSFFTDILGCRKPRKREEKQEKLGNFRKNEKFTETFLEKARNLPPFLAFLSIFFFLYSFLRTRKRVKKSRLPLEMVVLLR